MTLPILLFQGGTHGNFLSRCLSISSGTIEKFNLWGENHGAHANKHFKNIIDHLHPYDQARSPKIVDYTDTKDIHTFITFSHSDLYRIILWVFYAGGEARLNLLEDKNLRHRISKNNHPIVKDMRNIIKNFEDNDNGTQEFLKKMLTHVHSFLADQMQTQIDTRNISYIINYKDFFEKDSFIIMVKDTLTRLGFEYNIDISDMHVKFIERMQPFIQSDHRVKQAFSAWLNQEDYDLSNFLLVEKACLDYYIEQHLGYEIENWQEYPKNTKDLNPTEAWEGVRYEL